MQPNADDPPTPHQSGSAVPDPKAVFRLVGLPLLAGLEDGGETAENAAWALCVLARNCPELVDDLSDRLRAQCRRGNSEAALRTLATLESWYPERVRTALDGTIAPQVQQFDGWSFDRGVRADGGPQAALREASDVAGEIQRDGRPSVGEPIAETTTSTNSPGESAGRAPTSTKTTAESAEPVPEHDLDDVIATIELASPIEDISVLDSPSDARYGTSLRARATVHGEERGISVRVFDHGSAGRDFEQALTDRLAAWHRVGDAPGVAAVHGVGGQPRPWVVTDYHDRTLPDLDGPSIPRAVSLARGFARAVGVLHGRGVVHGGLDPKTVRLAGGDLGGQATPRLDCVGLLEVYRQHGRTARLLDPRFASPEHHDADRGVIDQATDVYSVGAIVYWLTTGRPPFEGSIDELRKAVVTSTPIPPSDVRPDLPTALDDVIEKAMATEKLTRYESVRRLYGDLQRLG